MVLNRHYEPNGLTVPLSITDVLSFTDVSREWMGELSKFYTYTYTQ